jgi:hypothetical protein
VSLLLSKCFRSRQFAMVAAITVAFSSMLHAQTTAPAQDMSSQTEVQQLRQLVQDLQARVSQLEKEPRASSAAPATQAVSAGQAEKPAPEPFEGLKDVLAGATLTGFVDTYYGINFNQPFTHLSGARSWDNMNSGLTLNMVQLALDKPPDAKASRTGYHVALAFGRQMDVFNTVEPTSPVSPSSVNPLIGHNRPGWDQYLMEAYFSYLAPVGKNGLQFDVGKFVTPMGAEVVPTKDNWNYSRSLLYDFALPIYHFGVRAKYTWNDKVNLAGFVLNGWNNVIDNNSGKTFAVSLGVNPTKKWAITANYMAGPETNDLNTCLATLPATGTPCTSVNQKANNHWRQVVDATVAYNLTKKLTLQSNVDYGRGDRFVNPGTGAPLFNGDPVWWAGVANYLRYVFDAKNAFTLRHEYYNDHMHEVTATYERRFASHMISRLEYRHDMSNRPVFLDHSGPAAVAAAPLSFVKDQDTFTVGLIYVLQKTE